MSVEILSTAGQLCEKSHLKWHSTSERSSMSLDVSGNGAIDSIGNSDYWSVVTISLSCTISDTVYSGVQCTCQPMTLRNRNPSFSISQLKLQDVRFPIHE